MFPLLQRMSVDLELSIYTLAELIRTAPYRYKVFTIPKRNGDPRTIAQPSRELKPIQRWLAQRELTDLPVHTAATAYKSGSRIYLNAHAHSAGRFLLKMDFSNFFPSIGPTDIEQHLRKFGNGKWDDQEIKTITRLVLWLPKQSRKYQLCIGGPSSPFISNTVMFDFDQKISDACSALDVVYTRYADDLAFSTSRPTVLEKVEGIVMRLLNEQAYPRLRLNDQKTVRTSKAHLRKITGLNITPTGTVSVGRERKRSIRTQIHYFANGRLSKDKTAELKGLLAFCLDAEPDFVARMRTHYGDSVLDGIFRTQTQPSMPRPRTRR